MEGGNGASNGRGITQFAEGEPKRYEVCNTALRKPEPLHGWRPPPGANLMATPSRKKRLFFDYETDFM